MGESRYLRFDPSLCRFWNRFPFDFIFASVNVSHSSWLWHGSMAMPGTLPWLVPERISPSLVRHWQNLRHHWLDDLHKMYLALKGKMSSGTSSKQTFYHYHIPSTQSRGHLTWGHSLTVWVIFIEKWDWSNRHFPGWIGHLYLRLGSTCEDVLTFISQSSLILNWLYCDTVIDFYCTTMSQTESSFECY